MTILMIRFVFHLPLRALEGFLNSLVLVMGIWLDTPSYSQICRRAQLLGKDLKRLTKRKNCRLIFSFSPSPSAHCLHALGVLYAELKKISESLIAHEEALKLRKLQLGENHIFVAESLAAIGLCHSKLGNHDLSIKTCELALQTIKRLDNEDSPQKAWILNIFGMCYLGNCDNTKAFENFNKASLMFKKTLGDGHPNAAASIEGIGSCHYNRKEYESARQKFDEALQIRLAAYGENDPTVAECLKSIGALRWFPLSRPKMKKIKLIASWFLLSICYCR